MGAESSTLPIMTELSGDRPRPEAVQWPTQSHLLRTKGPPTPRNPQGLKNSVREPGAETNRRFLVGSEPRKGTNRGSARSRRRIVLLEFSLYTEKTLELSGRPQGPHDTLGRGTRSEEGRTEATPAPRSTRALSVPTERHPPLASGRGRRPLGVDSRSERNEEGEDGERPLGPDGVSTDAVRLHTSCCEAATL